MLWVLLFFAVIGVAVYLVDKKMKAKYEDKFNPQDWDLPSSVELPAEPAPPLVVPQTAVPAATSVEKLRYQKKPSALPPERVQFYKAISNALAGEYSLLSYVNVADTLLVLEASNALVAQVATKNIAAQKFDFVVCDKLQLQPMCAVMLDESVDSFLANACESAQLPLVRFNIQPTYDSTQIRATILQTIGRLDASVADKAENISPALTITEINPRAIAAIEEKPQISATPAAEVSGANGIELKLCPSCSAVMVKRKAKNGADAGKMFWICSTYPKCRGMVLVK